MLPVPKTPADAISIDIEVDDPEDVVMELRDSDVELELGEADLVVMEEAPAASSMRPRMPSIPPPLPRASLPEIVLPAHPTPRPSRRTLDEKMVEDVTGQCLATIAEVTSRTRIPLSLVDAITAAPSSGASKRSSKKIVAAAPSSASNILTPPMRGRPVEEPEEETEQNAASSVKVALESAIRKKLPPISSPPFVRRSSASLLPSEREIVPRISPVAPSSTAIAMAADSRRPLSDAPVSVSKLGENTQVVVVREPPKAYWVAVAAVIGAAAAIGGMRLAAPSTPSSSAPASIAVEAPVAAPIAKDVVAPPPEKAAEKASSTVVHFGDGQGIAIPAAKSSHTPKSSEPSKPVVAATSKPPASAAPKSATTASPVPRPPRLPDGSYGLARSDAAPTPPPKEAPAPAAPPPPAPEKKAKNLTPEQQLAEAQLKASMK